MLYLVLGLFVLLLLLVRLLFLHWGRFCGLGVTLESILHLPLPLVLLLGHIPVGDQGLHGFVCFWELGTGLSLFPAVLDDLLAVLVDNL